MKTMEDIEDVDLGNEGDGSYQKTLIRESAIEDIRELELEIKNLERKNKEYGNNEVRNVMI